MKNIPNLNPLYEEVRDYVKEHQTPMGYLDTQNEENDTIHAYGYDIMDYGGNISEWPVAGIRVVDDEIEVVCSHSLFEHLTEADFTEADNCRNEDDEFKSWDNKWCRIRYDDDILFVPTLFSIAESIEQY